VTYDQYLAYDGRAVVYANRTAARAAAAGLGWFTPDPDDLTAANLLPVGQDGVPWNDPAFPAESAGFCGLVVTSVTPMFDSFVTRPVLPLARGGSVNGARYEGHREMVWAATIIARDRKSGVYGLEWLTRLFQFGKDCDERSRDRSGYDVELWAWKPTTRYGDHQRFLYEAHVTSGPKVLRERELSGGCGYIMDIEWTITAGNPGLYGADHNFGEFKPGTVKDAYRDLQFLGPNNTTLPKARTYRDLHDVVVPNATTYEDLQNAMVLYSAGTATDSTTNPWG
jgi:hypothetical protein